MAKGFLILIFIMLASFQDGPLIKTKVNKNITMLIPSDFIPIPPDDISGRFVSYRSPIAVYTNMAEEIDFGINNSMSRWRSTDIGLMQSFYKSNITNLYEDVIFLTEEIQVINKREFVVFEFLATMEPQEDSYLNRAPNKKYVYIQYTIVKGGLFLFDFSSPESQKDLWRPTISTMMKSVKIK